MFVLENICEGQNSLGLLKERCSSVLAFWLLGLGRRLNASIFSCLTKMLKVALPGRLADRRVA